MTIIVTIGISARALQAVGVALGPAVQILDPISPSESLAGA